MSEQRQQPSILAALEREQEERAARQLEANRDRQRRYRERHADRLAEQRVQQANARVAAGVQQLMNAVNTLALQHDWRIHEQQLFIVNEDQVVRSFNDEDVLTELFKIEPNFLDSQRKQALIFLKEQLRASEKTTLNLQQQVAIVAFEDDDVLTWRRLPFLRSDLEKQPATKLADAPKESALGAFRHLLQHCDDPQALTLWIGSLLDTESGRSQYLHLYGGGGNGKSTLFTGIKEVLGSQHVVDARADEVHQAHWGEALEGCRLLYFPDENNTRFFSSGKFKAITGEASITINPKYKRPRTVALACKVAVFSNNEVEITNNNADKRRLLSVSMRAEDAGSNRDVKWWYPHLRNGGAAILTYCYGVYLAAVKHDPTIRQHIYQQPSTVAKAVDRKYEDVMDAIGDSFVVTRDAADKIKRSDVYKRIREELGTRVLDAMTKQRVKEALDSLAINLVTESNNTAYFVGIKERGGFTQISKKVVAFPKI